MQSFINHGWIDRAAGEAFDSARARYYLAGALATGVAAAAGIALAAIWLGLVLLVEETRTLLLARVGVQPRGLPALALEAARGAAFATAPAMAWFSRTEFGVTLGVLTAAALMAHAALDAKDGARRAFAAAAPFALLALIFIADAAARGQAAQAGACALMLGFMFAHALKKARESAHRAREDEAAGARINTVLQGSNTVSWEADFIARRLVRGEGLSALLGTQLSFDDVICEAAFAAAHERALVQAAFTPPRGGFRRVAIEHDAMAGDGQVVRLRHEGLMRTSPEGLPERFSCVTRRVSADAEFACAAASAEQAMLAQQQSLRALANELAAKSRPLANAGPEGGPLAPRHLPAPEAEARTRQAG